MPRSWTDKLRDSKDLPRVERLSGPMATRYGKGTMLIPAPLEVDQVMRRIPRGKLITLNEIRSHLAKQHKATVGCPITTGIFAWIAAYAAAEQAAAGKKRTTPYWRTLKLNGELNPKYPGGIEGLRKQLESEGHRVVQKRKKFVVENYEAALADLT